MKRNKQHAKCRTVNDRAWRKLQDRYLFFQQDGVYVFQDKQIIKSFKYDDYISYNLDVYVYPKWVNISWGGVDHWFLSYSYNKNRFYERKKEEK